MKRIGSNRPAAKTGWFSRVRPCLSTAFLAITCISALADDGRYHQVNLVSDQAGDALLQDSDLVNAWGISFSPTSPFWVSDNGTGVTTLYSVTNNSSGAMQVVKEGLVVTIPGEGNPTGQLFNNLGGFNGDIFIFASEDGTISGWRPALGIQAEVLANRAGAVYKGITLANTEDGPVLLAANFSEGTVDVYGTNLTLTAQLSDPHTPAGYAPFNVQAVAGMIFVTFAKQDAAKEDDVAGAGHGLIDILNPETGVFHRFAAGSKAGGRIHEFNSPWGIAVAPKSFGKHGDELLVGNFGSGTIMAFEANGKFRGLLKGPRGRALTIPGLWGLSFGNGGRAGGTNTLFFTSGPDDESHGLFGGIEPGRRH